MRILYCGNGWLPITEAIAARRPDDRVEVWNRDQPLVEAVADVGVLLPSNAPISAEVIEAATPLLLIQQPAAGYDGVDLEAARARGIPVCNAPGANAVPVAETATYLMLALARRARAAAAAFAAGDIGVPVGMELDKKILGLVGFGQSGKIFARIAAGLGMHVLSINSRSSATARDEMLARADVVSLHCPLTERTRGLVCDDFLSSMKPGAFLINCARGPIIDRAALVCALDRGHLGGVGLDTYWQEPWDPADPLYLRPEVVTLPHIAGSSVEAFERITDIVVQNIRRVTDGLSPLHRVD